MLKPIILTAGLLTSCQAIADYYLIDVRTEEEYQTAHADGAVNIPLDIISTEITRVTKDKEAVIYLYCHSGRRAGTAQAILRQQGYTHVENLGTLANAQKFVANQQAQAVPDSNTK